MADRVGLLDSIAAKYERGEIQPAYDRSFFQFNGPAFGRVLREITERIRKMQEERRKR